MFNTQYFKQKKFYRSYLFRECKSSPRYLVSFKTLFTDYTLGLDVHSPVECFIVLEVVIQRCSVKKGF